MQNVEAGIFFGQRDKLKDCHAEKNAIANKYNDCQKRYDELNASFESLCKYVVGAALALGSVVVYKINAMNNKLKKLKRRLIVS
ncbi:hypothetical protein RSTT_P2-003 (plasmid) [Candidatus Endomicrobiellum trichonymphae]|nr:hypothetical protein RSTT_P2-003 [Candidatus Endomicrobium trichonymphae]